MSYLQSFDSAWFFDSYLINSKQWGNENCFDYFTGISWDSVSPCFGLSSLLSILSLEQMPATLLGILVLVCTLEPGLTVKMHFWSILKWMTITKKCSSTEVQFLLKTLGNLDFFDAFPTVEPLLPFRLHAGHWSVNVLILEEESTSSCSNGCINSMPAFGKNIPTLTRSTGYGLFSCAVPPRQRRTSNQPDRREIFQWNQQWAPLRLDSWAVDENKSMTGTVENSHRYCCSSALGM